jgi:RimJ/RimL family protein N-acetyltransferase
MSSIEKPLLLEIPAELPTARLRLRTPVAGDGAIVFPAVRESLAELKRWMPWATDAYDLQGAEEWCRRAAANYLSREQLQYMIFERQSDQYLGNVGAFKFNWEVPSCEIGYWLRTSHNGNGYMTEAVVGLRDMLSQLGMRRVQILCDERNLKSRRVADLARFRLEGILRNDSIGVNHSLRSTCVFSWVSTE